jgi:putative ABC transport system permease protein
MIVIINHTMAELYFHGQDPVGRRIQTGDPDPASPWETVVGVVGDVKYSGLDATPAPTIYVPFNENAWSAWSREMYLVVRSTGDRSNLVSAIRLQLKDMDATLPLAQVRTMDQLVDGSVMEERFRTWLVGSFAALALLLSAIGIYAVVAYSVSQRTKEIGVRIALGAKSRDVLSMVLTEGFWLLFMGLLLGISGALLATRVLRTLLYSTSTTDVPTFVLMSLVICGVTILACYLPARRATKVDPTVALRAE